MLQIVDNFVTNVEIKPGESLQLESENVRIEALDWHPDQDKGTDKDEDLQFTVPNQEEFREDSKDDEDDQTTDAWAPKSVNETYIIRTTTVRPQDLPPKVPVSNNFLFVR